MIYTRTIDDSTTPTTPPEKKPVKDNPIPTCEEFIKMIAEKQKQQEENQKITTPTPWEVDIGNRLSELGQAIAARGKIRNKWHRELCGICDFITYMEMGNMEEDHYD